MIIEEDLKTIKNREQSVLRIVKEQEELLFPHKAPYPSVIDFNEGKSIGFNYPHIYYSG